MNLLNCKTWAFSLCDVGHAIQDAKIDAQNRQKKWNGGGISFLIIGEQFEQTIRCSDDRNMCNGHQRRHSQCHHIILPSKISSQSRHPSCNSGDSHIPKIMLMKGVEEDGADKDIEDVEGIRHEKDHGLVSTVKLLSLWEDSQKGADHHEHGDRDRCDAEDESPCQQHYIQMQEGGFFNVEITDELVESLDDIAYGQLLEVLQLNFQQEYAHLTSLRRQKAELNKEIVTGQANLSKLISLQQEHQRQRVKMRSELELLEAECEAAKKQLKNEQ